MSYLPKLFLQIDGSVLDSNLADFEDSALQRINAIQVSLESDEDYARAKNFDIKWCRDMEKAIKTAKETALLQIPDVQSLFFKLDSIAEKLREKRLLLSGLVKNKETEIKSREVRMSKARLELLKSDLEKNLNGFKLPDLSIWNMHIDNEAKRRRTLNTLRSGLADVEREAKDDLILTFQSMLPNIKYLLPFLEDYEFLRDMQSHISESFEVFSAEVERRIEEFERVVKGHLEIGSERSSHGSDVELPAQVTQEKLQFFMVNLVLWIENDEGFRSFLDELRINKREWQEIKSIWQNRLDLEM